MNSDEIIQIANQLIATREPASTPGTVVWLTGLSGAGKSTIAAILERRLEAEGLPVTLLDGDALRRLFAADAGHGRAQRLALALAYGRLCAEIAARGVNVLCATMSMFHEVRDWNRANIGRYVEVYLRVPLDELRRRDPKGLYAAADAGRVGDVVGVHMPAEEPRNADLVIDHAAGRQPDDTAAMVLDFLKGRRS